MKIKELQECIEKIINEAELNPNDEVFVYDGFHDDYDKIKFVYEYGNGLIIQF